MHRSGTSCLAGSLERSGVYLGNVSRSGRFNAKGNHELKHLNRIHDEILAMNRSSWYQPPTETHIHKYYQQALNHLAKQLPRDKPCGVKDPRIVLLLDFWLRTVKPPYVLVGTFRHPLAVAKSLSIRNGFSEEEGINLWLKYNNKLIAQHKSTPFPMIEYDLTDLRQYRLNVTALGLSLGLKPNRFKLYRFISKKLEHHPCIELAIPPSCQESYAYLQQHRFICSSDNQ